MDEIAWALQMKSKSGAHRLLTCLEERGHIRRLARKSRAMELTDPDAPPPAVTAAVARVRVVIDANDKVIRVERSGEVSVSVVRRSRV